MWVERWGAGESWLAERYSYHEQQVLSRADPGKEGDDQGQAVGAREGSQGISYRRHLGDMGGWRADTGAVA